MKKISLCIPTFNRVDLLFESFNRVLEDDRINEIIINDDCSNKRIFDKISSKIQEIDNKKIKLYKNEKNLGVLHNKAKTVFLASNDWVILLDSDNSIGKDYLDKLIEIEDLCDKYFYCPQILNGDENYLKGGKKFLFNYKNCIDKKIDMQFIKDNIYLKNKELNTELIILLNSGNYFVNKEYYIKAYKSINHNIKKEYDPCDVFYFNYHFLLNVEGAHITTVKELQYYHRVHNGSIYINNAKRNQEINNELVKNIVNLKLNEV